MDWRICDGLVDWQCISTWVLMDQHMDNGLALDLWIGQGLIDWVWIGRLGMDWSGICIGVAVFVFMLIEFDKY